MLSLAIIGTGCIAPLDAFEVAPPLRIPMTDAGVILDRVIDAAEWGPSLILRDVFEIGPDPPHAGSYPFELRLMGDPTNLYVAVQVWNITPNERPPGEPLGIWADHIDLYLAPDRDELRSPADQLGAGSVWEYGSNLNDGYWTGSAWRSQPRFDGDRDFNEGKPHSGRWSRTGADRENRTQWWEFQIERSSELVDVDGFQAIGPSVFRACIQFAREPPDLAPSRSRPWDMYNDTYPEAGISTAVPFDPSRWLRLSFDY